MPDKPRDHAEDLRAANRLLVEATTRVTEAVQAMHDQIASGPAVLGRPLAAPVRALNGVVYGSIRGVTLLVGRAVDAVLAALAPVLGEGAPGPEREAVVAALNGVVGDFLAETRSPLAIEMCLRRDGVALVLEREALRAAIPAATGKVLVLVHGSSMNDRGWRRSGHDHGEALARDLGYTPVYLLYNSGLHVAANGRELDALLERLVEAWPVPVEELAILAHSMGGLVARSACLVADREPGRAWRKKLTKLVFLGTPHHGAPLERGGNGLHFLLGVSRYSAPLAQLARLRSAGVTDLRFGHLLDEDAIAPDRFAFGPDRRAARPLPAGVRCFAIAATTSPAGGRSLFGDGLVPVESALGRHARAELTLAFPETCQWVAYGTGHLDLLDRPDVYAKIRDWLADAPAGAT